MSNEIAEEQAASTHRPVFKDTKVVRGYPLIGSVVDMLRDGPRFVARVARAHPGEVVGIQLGPVKVYLVTAPDHVKHVLHEDWRAFGKGGMWKAIRTLVGNGLATSEGEFWMRQRRLMQPIFSAGHLAKLTELMVDVIEQDVTRLSALGPTATVDMQREMLGMVQRVVFKAIFGSSVTRGEADRLIGHLGAAFKGLNLRMFLYFLPEGIPLPGERHYRASIAAIDEAMFRLVRARRAEGGEHHDLLSLLMDARDSDTGEGMDERQIRDELVTMFVGGNETTGTAMTWLWYALDQNPAVERRLRAEVAEVLGDRRPTFADLSRLTYTKQVIQEVLRIYPPLWMIPRFSEKETTIGAHRIPAGSVLLLSPFASHRDPAIWPDPEAFDPERFTPERSAGRPRYAYYPFGGGPRQCIGNNLALMEAQLITAMMTQRLRPSLAPGHRVVLSTATALVPRYGMKMTLGG